MRGQREMTPGRSPMPLVSLAAGLVLAFSVTAAGCGDDVGAGASSTANADTGGGGNIDTGLGEQDTGEQDAGEQDTGEQDAGTTDIGEQDTGEQDTGDAGADTGPDCPGDAGCACAKNSDCDSGACLDTQDGQVCAKGCTDTCPDGFKCKAFGSSDAFFVCFPQWTSLCSPCAKHADCKTEGAEAKCIQRGTSGSFCGADCSKDTDCPADYACKDYFDKDANKTFKQCQLKDDKAECGCSKWATSAGFTTSCSQSNALGTCTADRKCTDKGLTACAAKAPEVETCDSADNDCDGTVDNLPAEATCAVEATLPDGTKAACPGTPKCGKDGKIICEGAKTPAAESCDSTDNDCDGKTDEDFSWTDPTDAKITVAVGGACGVGPCVGGQVICKNPTAAVCDSEQKNATAEKCDGKDNDCDGKTDDEACADGNECTIDKCDSGSSKCTNTPGADCDDKNQCTADSCDTKTGKCVNKAESGKCDDGDACTVGDACKISGDKATCEPGGDKPKCDDANICTDDACDKDKGCVSLANAVTQACYSGAKGTENTGTCTGGTQFCKAGVLEATCVGQTVPAAKEACDGKDDTCDGKTDEGCSITGVNAGFVAVSGAGDGKQYGARVNVGGANLVGGRVKTANGKYALGAGWLEWLSGLLDGGKAGGKN